jgi:hypothetical protein
MEFGSQNFKAGKTLALSASLLCGAVIAAPFTITSQLTGDSRSDNPDELVVDVKITSNTLSNEAYFVVDINSPLHPDIKLDEFYFNVTGSDADYSFSDFTPTGWTLSSPGSVAGGGAGGATFLFEAVDPSGPPKADDVTNSQNLEFTLILNNPGDLFTADIFLTADTTDLAVGEAQLGAHLQSLDVNSTTCPGGGCSDSGFAIGNYTSGGTITTSGTPVPSPGPLTLIGAGMIGGLFYAQNRRTRKSES